MNEVVTGGLLRCAEMGPDSADSVTNGAFGHGQLDGGQLVTVGSVSLSALATPAMSGSNIDQYLAMASLFALYLEGQGAMHKLGYHLPFIKATRQGRTAARHRNRSSTLQQGCTRMATVCCMPVRGVAALLCPSNCPAARRMIVRHSHCSWRSVWVH